MIVRVYLKKMTIPLDSRPPAWMNLRPLRAGCGENAVYCWSLPQEVQQLGPALKLTNHYKHPPSATRDGATQEKEDAHMSKTLILCGKAQSQRVIIDSHGCPGQNRGSPFTSQKAGPPATVCVCPGNSLSASTSFFDTGRNG